jgi:hypothetical protein
MKKYFTEEQLADLRNRWSPEVKAASERGWSELARDTEEAISRGDLPGGQAGRQLAARRQKLLEQFTGGDPGIRESLRKLYADQSKWPESFKKPFSDAVDKFLHQAGEKLKKASPG